MSNRHHAHRRTARAGITALITACLLFTAPPRNIASARQQTEVYLLGSLYKRHETVAAYDLATLRRIIAAIAPDVLVVDCTPREVNEEKVHASKVEYPGVIFPMARERKLRMYAAEPDEPMFTEIVQSIVEAQARLEKERPDASAAMKALGASVYQALAVRWRSPADVHDEATAAMLAAKTAYDASLVGAPLASGNERWNRHWADAIATAAAENPGRRVLAIAGIENRAAIARMVSANPRVTLVDMARWLDEHRARIQPGPKR